MRRREEAARRTFGTRFIVAPAPDEDAGWSALVREATLTGSGLIIELDDDVPDRIRHL